MAPGGQKQTRKETTVNTDICSFETLAPEVKKFLKLMKDIPQPPISMKTYKAIRQFMASTVKNVERQSFSGTVEDITIPGPARPIPVRVYRPDSAKDPLPLLLYFHGGGFVLGDLDMEEDTCIALGWQTPCVVVSVDYALAPEHPSPAAREEAYAALLWAAGHAGEIGADAGRIAVAGQSAGGNLAAVISIMSRDLGGPTIAFQALFYPATDLAAGASPSRRDFSKGFFLDARDMEGVVSMYVPDEKDRLHPYVSPLRVQDASRLPPALVVTAGCDPLRDEGEAYARRLSDAGVKAEIFRLGDMIHAFLYLFKSAGSTRRVIETTAARLREAFGPRT